MSRQHLSGIIPIAGITTDFEIDLPEIMMPVSSGFTAIQKSVHECALAGCNTIWIVANPDLAPVLGTRNSYKTKENQTRTKTKRQAKSK